MIRYIVILFVGITMTYAPVNARRSGERSSPTKTSKAKKQTSRRGVGGGRRVTNARTAKITVAGEVVEGIDLTTETETAEDIGTTDVLQEQVDTVKKEINAIEQCVATLCDAGTGEESTKMALCSDKYKKKKLEKQEGELRKKEDKVRITLADLPRMKLSTAERKIYDSIQAPEKEENDLGDDSMNFDDLMAGIEDMSDAINGEGAKKRITGNVLLTKAVDLCAKKFPDVIDDKQNFIDLMTVRADNSANDLAEYYDKKAYKLNVAFEMAMKKLRMASVNKHRDNLDTDSCVKSILAKAQGIYGTDFEELAKCDDLTSNCSAKNFAQFEDTKKAFTTTLESCKDGNGAWEIALLKVKRTLEQTAKTEIFDSKTQSIEQLAETRQVCLTEMRECLENLSGEEVGYVSFLSADPFNSKKTSSIALYKDTNDKKANNIFKQMSEQYGMKITRLSRKESQKICVPYVNNCHQKLELLSHNPTLSKEMLNDGMNEEDLFKQSYMKIQFLADKKWVENEGKILTERLEVIKKQRTVQLAMIKGEYDVKTKKTTSKQGYEITKAKAEYDTKTAKTKAKQGYEVSKVKAEYNTKTAKTKAKQDYEITELNAKYDVKNKKNSLKYTSLNKELKDKYTYKNKNLKADADFTKTKTDALLHKFKSKKTPFYTAICDSYDGRYDLKKDTCTVAVVGNRGKRVFGLGGSAKARNWKVALVISAQSGVKVNCKKGFHNFKFKPDSCSFSNGNSIKRKKSCEIPSLEKAMSYAKAGKSFNSCFGKLDLGKAMKDLIINVEKANETETDVEKIKDFSSEIEAIR